MQFVGLRVQDCLFNYYRSNFTLNDLHSFQTILNHYQQNLIKFGSENEDGLVANALVPFLQQCGFQSQTKYKQKGKSEIDLVLLQDSKPKVIIEAKKWQSNEFFSPNNINCKALHECVLYFFRELDSNNFNISFLIITNFREFYVFNAKEFKRLFWDNNAIQNLWKAYKDDTSLMGKNTQVFYENLREIIDSKEFWDFKSRHILRSEETFNTSSRHCEEAIATKQSSLTRHSEAIAEESHNIESKDVLTSSQHDNIKSTLIHHKIL